MNYFIDCGMNRGQSISSFRKYFFQGRKWNYIGYEPANKGLKKNSHQIIKMNQSIKENSKFFETFQVFDKAVGSISKRRIFWYFYGAGSTGNIIKIIKMFLKDLKNLKFKNAMRIFKFTILDFEDITKVVKDLKEKGCFISLKLDIEGHEFEILESMISRNIFPNQLLIEYHSSKINYPISKTKALHKYLFDKNIDIFLWSADDTPPMKKLGRYLNTEDC